MLLMSQTLVRTGHTFVTPSDTNLIPTMLNVDGSHTYQASDVSVTQVGSTYTASIPGGDAAASTWFNTDEGRLDYVTFTGDFDVVATNIGLASGATVDDFQFCGLAVWLSSQNYEFAVAGNRGATTSTVEYKSTLAGSSVQNDTGASSITSHRCDLRVERSGSTVTFYRRAVGGSTWTTIPHSGLSHRVSFGTGAVRVGILTYGFAFVAAFTSECISVVATTGTPS
jgi:hypothetical protein